jgi:hypothetical protein
MGVWQGGSHSESSLHPISSLRVIYDSQLHGYELFMAIWIRVNLAIQNPKELEFTCYYQI